MTVIPEFHDFSTMFDTLSKRETVKWYPRTKGPLENREYPRNSPSDNDVENQDFYYGSAWIVPDTELQSLEREITGVKEFTEYHVRININEHPWNIASVNMQDIFIINPDSEDKMVFEVVKIKDFGKKTGTVRLVLYEVD